MPSVGHPKRLEAQSVLLALRRRALPARVPGLQRFFKTGPGEYAEGDRFLGLTVPDVRAVAADYAALPRREAAALLRSPWHEARTTALLILVRQHQRGTPRDRDAIYRLYLRNTRRINNWDLVDCSAEHIVGAHLRDHRRHRGPEGPRHVLNALARSSLVWDRRIAVLATFHLIKRGEFGETLRLARLLAGDEHDLIHKACGWMLREVGKRDQPTLEQFLRRHGPRLPRTTLRYAIERFPPRLRRQHLMAPRPRSRR